MANETKFTKAGRTVRLTNGWRGSDGTIAAGEYDVNDPALLGRADYLLANGHAVEGSLNLTPAEYMAAKDVPGVVHAPAHPQITQEQADKSKASDVDGDDVPNSADVSIYQDDTRSGALSGSGLKNAVGEGQEIAPEPTQAEREARTQQQADERRAEQRKSSSKKS